MAYDQPELNTQIGKVVWVKDVSFRSNTGEDSAGAVNRGSRADTSVMMLTIHHIGAQCAWMKETVAESSGKVYTARNRGALLITFLG